MSQSPQFISKGDAHAGHETRAAEPPIEERAPARSFEEPTLVDKAISAGLWGAGLGWLAPALGTMAMVYEVVPAHRVNFLGRAYCKVQIALTGSRWKAVVHPDIDPDRPYIFAQNHTNHYDHVMLYNATPHYKQGLELESHFDYPFYGRFMRNRGTIPVKKHRSGQTNDLVEKIGNEMREGRSILAFPEGTRTRTGRVGPFKKGIFHVARELGAPIVPVAVTGTFDLMRPGSWVIRPGNQLTVHCEKPIETVGLSEDDVPALTEEVRSVMSSRIDEYWAARERERAERGRAR